MTTKHDFYREDGDIDAFRLDAGYHNGPQCKRCGEMKCKHCHPEFETEECPSGQLDLF